MDRIGAIMDESYPQICPLIYPQPTHMDITVKLHLHLVSDSTGETLENIAKAALAQFDDVAVTRHFWPMVRSPAHLQRIMVEVSDNPGLVLFTLVNRELRTELERGCAALGLPAIAALDTVYDALSQMLGQKAKARPGRQHILDDAYFARVEAIHYTMAHDDGISPDGWEDADIVIAGVSRSSKTPTSIYLANRGYKTANIPIIPVSPPPPQLFALKAPLVVGLTTSADRLVAVRRNRLSTMGEDQATTYADAQAVKQEIGFAKRMFADNDWPVIDVTRRSIEETASAIIKLYEDRRAQQSTGSTAGAEH